MFKVKENWCRKELYSFIEDALKCVRNIILCINMNFNCFQKLDYDDLYDDEYLNVKMTNFVYLKFVTS